MISVGSNNPKISVIMPVYNGERYLSQTLKSISDQTFVDLEVVVVNDGSMDSTPEILRQAMLSDSRIRVIDIPNSGQSVARNMALDVAGGEWITFLDADDILYNEALETMYNAAISNDADIVCANIQKGELFVPRRVDSSTGFKILDRDATLKRMLYQTARDGFDGYIFNCVWGKLIRRSIFASEPPLRFVSGLYYEDLEISHRMYDRASKIVITSDCLYFYRQHADSFIHTFAPRRLDALIVTDSILDHFRTEHPNHVNAALDRRFSAHYNMLLNIMRCRPAGPVPEKYHCLGTTYDAIEDRCWKVIVDGRAQALSDPNVRLKNKLGSILSYGGRAVLRMISAFQ